VSNPSKECVETTTDLRDHASGNRVETIFRLIENILGQCGVNPPNCTEEGPAELHTALDDAVLETTSPAHALAREHARGQGKHEVPEADFGIVGRREIVEAPEM
jgi:hypothetical protein